MPRTLLALLLVTAAALVCVPSTALAGNLDVNVHIGKPGDQYVLKGQIDLKPGERARTLGMACGSDGVVRRF